RNKFQQGSGRQAKNLEGEKGL
ncbi:MAG: hypothetical protein JWN60_1897, partial [Acidobacteria bacterium]|nr:hypothetical protein [Acidobacteriota bacterium]